MVIKKYQAPKFYPIFQSKTLTLKNKNKIFPKFLSPTMTTTYEKRDKKKSCFIDSKLPTHLIIEALLFCLGLGVVFNLNN